MIFKSYAVAIFLPSCSSIINQSAFNSKARAIADDSPGSNLVFKDYTKLIFLIAWT